MIDHGRVIAVGREMGFHLPRLDGYDPTFIEESARNIAHAIHYGRFEEDQEMLDPEVCARP